MPLKYCLAAAFAAVATAGPIANAGLFDRLRERAESSGDADRAEAADGVSFAVANEREIGKFVHPVTYQPLPAPTPIDGSLQPVPDPGISGPGSTPAFYPPAMPGEPFIGGHPLPAYPAGPEAFPGGAVFDGMPLYHRVRYKDLDNIHPCGVPTVVQVLDPCEDRCDSCGPRCVFVKIRVPPNERPRIKVERRGRKVKYKFDDYQVEIESEDGLVTVDYDD